MQVFELLNYSQRSCTCQEQAEVREHIICDCMNEYLVETLLIIYHCIHTTKCLTLGIAAKHEKSKRKNWLLKKGQLSGREALLLPICLLSTLHRLQVSEIVRDLSSYQKIQLLCSFKSANASFTMKFRNSACQSRLPLQILRVLTNIFQGIILQS